MVVPKLFNGNELTHGRHLLPLGLSAIDDHGPHMTSRLTRDSTGYRHLPVYYVSIRHSYRKCAADQWAITSGDTQLYEMFGRSRIVASCSSLRTRGLLQTI